MNSSKNFSANIAVSKLTIQNIQTFFPSRSGFGESIFFREVDSTLHFVDSRRRLLHRLALSPSADGNGLSEWSNHKVVATKDPVGVAVELADDPNRLVVGAKYGFAVVDTETGEMKYVARVYKDEKVAERFRMSDGAVDSRGRLWAGTLIESPRRYGLSTPLSGGSLFSLEPSGKVITHLDGCCGVPNGLGWSPDDQTMYWIDSADATIYAFDFDADHGRISNKRVFANFKIPGSTQVPNGLCVDVDGCTWTAMYQGGRVIRLSPQGQIILEIRVPVWRVTCLCFGGEEMDELFVTSGELDFKDKSHRLQYAQDGNVFRLKLPGVKGIPKNRFGQLGGLSQDFAFLRST